MVSICRFEATGAFASPLASVRNEWNEYLLITWGEVMAAATVCCPLVRGRLPRSIISFSFELHEESTNGLFTALSRASNNQSSDGSIPRHREPYDDTGYLEREMP